MNLKTIAIALLCLAIIMGCQPQTQPLDTDKPADADVEAAMAGNKDQPAAQPAERSQPEDYTPPPAADQVLDQTLDLSTLPLSIPFELVEGQRYQAEFTLDQPLQVVVYNEKRHNEWKTGGSHTISKATTKSGAKCCEAEGALSFGLNKGETGTYYIVFDDGRLKDTDPRPTTGIVRITRSGTI